MLCKAQVAKGLLEELTDLAREYNHIYPWNPLAASISNQTMIGIAHFASVRLDIQATWKFTPEELPMRITHIRVQWNDQELVEEIKE